MMSLVKHACDHESLARSVCSNPISRGITVVNSVQEGQLPVLCGKNCTKVIV